jgi:hypothetical protein
MNDKFVLSKTMTNAQEFFAMQVALINERLGFLI